MHVAMYVYEYPHPCKLQFLAIGVFGQVCVYIRLHACMYVSMYVYKYPHRYVFLAAEFYRQICLRECVCVCVVFLCAHTTW